MMGNEDAIALLSRQVQEEVEGAVMQLFPGFAWLELDNRGADEDYQVVINDRNMGANLREISLLPGNWNVSVLQEIEDEVYVMGRQELFLEVDDYYRLVFELSRTPPFVPGYLRIERSPDDWKVGFEFGYDFLIPITDDSEESLSDGYAVLSRFMINDFLFPGLVAGVDTGVGRLYPLDEPPDGELEIFFIPLFGFLGYRVGPLGGVDFTVKVAGGPQLTRSEFTFDGFGAGEAEEEVDDEILYTGRGSVEFGFNWGRSLRFHLGASFWGMWDEPDLFGFIGLQGGVGFKF